MAKVAVIIACFNSENTVTRAIQSILNQSFRDLILYVIDDASTDNSLAKIMSIKDERLRVIKLECNLGPSGARNQALFKAKEEYVAILDADDFSYKERLQVQVDYLSNNQSIALVGGLTNTLQNKQTITSSRPYTSCGTRWIQLFNNCFSHSTVMYRRDAAIHLGGYDTSLSQAEDFALFSQLTIQNASVNIPTVFSFYTSNNDGISKVFPDTLIACAISVVKKNILSLTEITISKETAAILHLVKRDYKHKTILKAVSINTYCLKQFLNDNIVDYISKKEITHQQIMLTFFLIQLIPFKKWYLIWELTKNILSMNPFLLIDCLFIKVIIPNWLKKLLKSH